MTDERTPLPEASPTGTDSARLLRTLIDNIPAMVGYWDSSVRNVLANAAYLDWLGMAPEDMTGLHAREVLGDELFIKNVPYIEAALAGEPQMFDREITDASGALRYSQIYYIPDVDEAGHVEGLFVLATDVSARVIAERELAAAHAELELRTMSDALTGLSSRAFLEERLEHALAVQAQSGCTIALLMIDLDGFKPVNDRHGHAAGDAILVQIAVRLRSMVRKTDLVARFGGDEFVILCPTVGSADEVAALAGRVVEAVKAVLKVPGVDEPISVAASIGVVISGPCRPEEAPSADELMREVDRRMYEAKRAGGSRWQQVRLFG